VVLNVPQPLTPRASGAPGSAFSASSVFLETRWGADTKLNILPNAVVLAAAVMMAPILAGFPTARWASAAFSLAYVRDARLQVSRFFTAAAWDARLSAEPRTSCGH
jgi:hypothetical protein